ncbi:MAG: hypothetical protein V3R99_08965 [Thermoguttaceae bacterium]
MTVAVIPADESTTAPVAARAFESASTATAFAARPDGDAPPDKLCCESHGRRLGISGDVSACNGVTRLSLVGSCTGKTVCVCRAAGGSVTADESVLGCRDVSAGKADCEKIESRSCKGRPLRGSATRVWEDGGVERVVFGCILGVCKSLGKERVAAPAAGLAPVRTDGPAEDCSNERLPGIRTGVPGGRLFCISGDYVLGGARPNMLCTVGFDDRKVALPARDTLPARGGVVRAEVRGVPRAGPRAVCG